MKRAEKKKINDAHTGTIKLLARNAARLNLFLVNMPIPFLRVSNAGTILDVHRPEEAQLPHADEDIIGRSIKDIYAEETAVALQKRISDVLQTGDSMSFEHRLPIEGQMHTFHLKIIPITHDEVLLLANRVLDKHSIEEDILRAHQIDSIGLVAGSIAHDFNNVLMAILGNIQYAAAELARLDLPDISESLADAEAACLRANEVTRKLSSFTNDANPNLKKMELANVVRETAALGIRGSNCKLEVQTDPQLWSAMADSAQISRVIHNLVQNAVQASVNGGTITISATNIDLTRPSNTTLAPGRYIRVSVADQGRGIPPAQLAKIFLPQFNPSAQRIGLGLPICFSIMKHHKGRIEAESKYGHGATFHIYIPAAVAQDPAPITRLATPLIRNKEANASNGHILLMDDDHSLRKIMQRTLSKDGYRTDEAADGDEAIALYEKARAENDPYDLVILDLYIPGGKGGAETLTALRTINPRIKAIMSTGCVDKKVIQSCADLGFNAIITKPYRREMLNEVLRAVIENRPIPTNTSNI